FFASRRRHTRCYRDWSSDVCSSDLLGQLLPAIVREQLAEGNDTAFCSRCGDQVGLPSADAPIRLTRTQSAELAAERHTVGQRSRSEERRVGKECRSRSAPTQEERGG